MSEQGCANVSWYLGSTPLKFTTITARFWSTPFCCSIHVDDRNSVCGS
jgi:hypothetical protein